MVRVLGLHVVASGSSPVLTSGQDLFPVVTDSTLLVYDLYPMGPVARVLVLHAVALGSNIILF